MNTENSSALQRHSQLLSNDSGLSRSRVDTDAKISSSNGGLQTPAPPDIMNQPYMNVPKVPDSMSKGLSDSLAGGLLGHGVVDLEASEFSQQSMVGSQYYDDDILSQGLTDDDRRLAAALVAVQLSKANNQTNPSAPDQQQAPSLPQQAQMLPNDLLNPKPLSSMPPIDKPAMPGMVPNYMQSVDDGLVHEQLSMLERSSNIFPGQTAEPPSAPTSTAHQSGGVKVEVKEEYLSQVENKHNADLKKDGNDSSNSEDGANDSNLNESSNNTSKEENSEVNTTGVTDDFEMPSEEDEPSEKSDDFDSDYEEEIRRPRKSLPHKKRIPKKLKRGTTMAPTRNPHAKGAKPSKQAVMAAAAAAKGNAKFNLKCELCTRTFTNQLKFFEHLKSHYEPLITISTPKDGVSSTSKDREITQNDFNAALELSSSDSTQVKDENVITTPPLSCEHCGKTFRRPKALETHIAMTHAKREDMEDFSEPEDMMEGIGDMMDVVEGIEKPAKIEKLKVEKSSSSSSWSPQKRKRGRPRKADIAARAAAAAAAAAEAANNPDYVPPPPPEPKKRGRPKKAWKEAEAASSDNGFGLDMDLMSPFMSDKSKKPKKTLACTLCPRVFNHRNSLMYHVRSHSGQRPHQCEVCGKSFFAASALKVHLRLHSGAKPYKCEYCERHFRQWGDLKYHITSIHTDQKQFQCEYCGKDFARKYSLIVHRRIHTGEKNYICEFCHKSFRASSYLQNHRRIHTGEKPHQCQICGKPFRVRSDMKRHVATHNKAMVTSSHLQNNDVSQRLGLMPTASSDHHVAHAAHHSAHPAVVRAPDGTVTLTKVHQDNHHDAHDHYKNMKNPLLVRFGEEQDSALPDGSNCSAPLNLNIRPHSDSDDGLAYSRESLERESSTLYVWIPAGADHLLQD